MSKLYTIFGGQFGSEGKGQIAMYLAQTRQLDLAVRVGGPNAGHTSYHKGEKVVVQSLPTPAFTGTKCIIGPEGLIIWSLLLEEMVTAYMHLGKPVTLLIDGNAGLITNEHMLTEASLKGRIGSTGEGVGAATADRVMRKPEMVVKANLEKLFNDSLWHPAFGAMRSEMDTVTLANETLLSGGHVLIEGTQGYGLSLLTSGYYPYCTSRECTPQALWAGTGINPKNASETETIMVIRTHPIRVGGNSGPLYGEMTWSDLAILTEGLVTQPEITTVTKKARRIGRLDVQMLKRAVMQTRPDCLAVTFVDYMFPSLAKKDPRQNRDFQDFAAWLTDELAVPVRYACTGPEHCYELEG